MNKKEYDKLYKQLNKQRVSESQKAYREKNRELMSQKALARYHANKEKCLAVQKLYRISNIERVREKDKLKKQELRKDKESCRAYAKDYYKRNSLRIRVRNRINKALRQQNISKKDRILSDLGIDIQKILAELGPCPGGLSDWHIDHIKPICSFDLNNRKEFLTAFSPENHQWLTAQENLFKNAKCV